MISKSTLLSIAAAVSLTAAGPCDIYASGNTPCVAAHSTTRALYDGFNGALYQVQRGSDGAKSDIRPLSRGGTANAGSQDRFCAGTTCLITIVYDQSGRGNHLTQAPPGGAASGPQPGGYDNLASASGAPVMLNGKRAYGVFISPGTGYRNDATNGIATGDAPEGMYSVLDGTHYNDGCCFDYGNAETSNTDTGDGHMETIYFGNSKFWSVGSGSGPWIMGDLENGLFSGSDPDYNPNDPTVTYRFLTAIVKGRRNNHWAIRGADAAGGGLSTFYSGARPDGYNPMRKEGAILLGIGGDNSNFAQGTFYEGAITSGYPSDATENSVQANIVAAGYAAGSSNSGPTIGVGSSVSFQATTPGYTNSYLTHSGQGIKLQAVSGSSSNGLKQQASWIARQGLGRSDCLSFESKDTPGSYIHHFNFKLRVDADDGSKQFHEDATFCPRAGLNGQGNSLRSWNYPTRFIRHYNRIGYVASNGGPEDFDATAMFNNDVSFQVRRSFA